MITTPAARRWAEDAAATAQARLDALDAALADVGAALHRVARGTDWQSPSARAFHEDAVRLHADVRGIRAETGEVEDVVARVRARLAADATTPP